MAVADPERVLTDEQRQQIWSIHIQLQQRQLINRIKRKGPKTDDELWQAVYELTSYKIPRTSVCPNHVAPFTVFADMYFERRIDVLMIGNRGGGKTTISGFLHGACCRWKPQYNAVIAGATEKQSGRAYTEFKRFIRKLGQEVVDSLKSLTTWLNGSLLEVITATIKGVNGPHPHLAQFDEAELSTRTIFEEFQNMAQGDDNYPAQNLLSTTRKFAFGIIQEIVNRVDEDLKEGNTPEWDICIFCIFETMQNVPNCGNGCDCANVVKGRWPLTHPTKPGEPRTFEDVCGGRAARSDGFVRLEDAHRRFKRLSMEVWEAQQECLRPNPEGLVHSWLHIGEHVITTWLPEPEFGDIYRTWDWGGTNPHAVLFNQLLSVPVEHEGRVFQEGMLITFDEIYVPDLSFTELGVRVAHRTKEWRRAGFAMDVEEDICDPAGGVAKRDAANGMLSQGEAQPIWRSHPTPRIESIKKHVEWGRDDSRLIVVGPYCPNLLDEYSKAHRPEDKDGKPRSEDMVKVDDHALDALRMLIWRLYRMELNNAPEDVPTSNANRGVTKEDKRPGMRGALQRQFADAPDLPVPTGYLAESPGPHGTKIGRKSQSPVGSRGRHSLKRSRIGR